MGGIMSETAFLSGSRPPGKPWPEPELSKYLSLSDRTIWRLIAAGKLAVQTVAVPAFQRFDKFFREVYLPASRDTVGISNIPGGDQYYRNRINYFTTVSNMDAARIHNMGLEEVKRIRAEMEKTLEGINFLGTLEQFLAFIRTDPRFFYKSSDELFAAYQKTARGIEPQLGKLFGHLPKSSFDIKPISDLTAPTTTTAYYMGERSVAARMMSCVRSVVAVMWQGSWCG